MCTADNMSCKCHIEDAKLSVSYLWGSIHCLKKWSKVRSTLRLSGKVLVKVCEGMPSQEMFKQNEQIGFLSTGGGILELRVVKQRRNKCTSVEKLGHFFLWMKSDENPKVDICIFIALFLPCKDFLFVSLLPLSLNACYLSEFASLTGKADDSFYTRLRKPFGLQWNFWQNAFHSLSFLFLLQVCYLSSKRLWCVQVESSTFVETNLINVM